MGICCSFGEDVVATLINISQPKQDGFRFILCEHERGQEKAWPRSSLSGWNTRLERARNDDVRSLDEASRRRRRHADELRELRRKERRQQPKKDGGPRRHSGPRCRSSAGVHPVNQLDDLFPRNWKPPEAVTS